MILDANMLALATKTVLSTRPIDFDFLEEIGILDELTRLTASQH